MRSLRGRLTLGVILVLAAVLTVSLTVVSQTVRDAEREALDDRLQRTAELSRETALKAVDEELPDPDGRLDAVLGASGTSLRLIFGPSVLLDTGDPPPTRPATRVGLRTFTVDGENYRQFTTRLQDPALGDLARLEVTTRLTRVEARQRELDRRLAALGVLALLVAAAGTWLAAELLLRPLRRLRAMTSSIAGSEDLGRRVPADDGPAELRALAGSFNGMLARLGRSSEDRERALAATRRFAADAGHELRTPLTSVQATLSALSRHPDVAADRRAGMLEDALAEQRRLVALLDGLQALARGDATPAAEEELDLAELVDVVVTAAAARHPATRYEPHLPDACPLRGWEPGLRVLVDNLVENAARHGRPGGTVRITLAGTPPVLDVEDDGPGIPEAERDAVLEPFVRAVGTTAPGSGLGLALAAQQARLHGAHIEVLGSAALGGAHLRVAFGPPYAP